MCEASCQWCHSADFGYTNDPTAYIQCYKLNNTLIFDEVIYRTGLLNSDIKDLLRSNNVGMTAIYADSAEPKSIAEIRRYGFNIKGADKGRDSVLYGINILQQHHFLVTKRSTNLIKELRNYTWDTSKTGEKLNNPYKVGNVSVMDGVFEKQTKKEKAPAKTEAFTKNQLLEKEVSRESLRSVIQSIRKSNPNSSAVDILTDVYKGTVCTHCKPVQEAGTCRQYVARHWLAGLQGNRSLHR